MFIALGVVGITGVVLVIAGLTRSRARFTYLHTPATISRDLDREHPHNEGVARVLNFPPPNRLSYEDQQWLRDQAARSSTYGLMRCAR